MKRRSLTDEEQQLWEQVTQGDIPIHHKRHNELRSTDDKIKHIIVKPVRTFSNPSSSVIRHPSSNLMCGAYANIDRNTAERFRKGEMLLDGTIDLHGMSREKAHAALQHFIHMHCDRGSRCLLAITGKGSSSSSSGKGILRELLPNWLAEPGMRPMILAFDVAKAKHGGEGAYYILLRRIRHG